MTKNEMNEDADDFYSEEEVSTDWIGEPFEW